METGFADTKMIVGAALSNTGTADESLAKVEMGSPSLRDQAEKLAVKAGATLATVSIAAAATMAGTNPGSGGSTLSNIPGLALQSGASKGYDPVLFESIAKIGFVAGIIGLGYRLAQIPDAQATLPGVLLTVGSITTMILTATDVIPHATLGYGLGGIGLFLGLCLWGGQEVGRGIQGWRRSLNRTDEELDAKDSLSSNKRILEMQSEVKDLQHGINSRQAKRDKQLKRDQI